MTLVDATWIAPPAVLGIGAALVAVLLRALAGAVDDLRTATRRARRIEQSLIPLRVDTRRTSDAVERLRRR